MVQAMRHQVSSCTYHNIAPPPLFKEMEDFEAAAGRKCMQSLET